MTGSPEVKIADESDLDDVMQLTLSCHHENGFIQANPQKVLQDLYPALTRNGGIVGIIGGRGKPLEGCVVLRIGQVSYSDVDVLEEKFLFVHKDYRAASVGRARLLAEFTKKAADMLSMPLIIGVLSNHRTKAKVRLYERVFGEPAGAFFLYNARTDSNLNPPAKEA
jgi:GNAT superfamily N-acetyltransferase